MRGLYVIWSTAVSGILVIAPVFAQTPRRVPQTYEECVAQQPPPSVPLPLYQVLCAEKYRLEPERARARTRALEAEGRRGKAWERERPCGQGSVMIEVISTECPRLTPREALFHVEGRAYRRDPEGKECDRREEFWSDWPECGGRPF